MGLVDVLLPPACAACGRIGDLVCARCIETWAPPSSAADRFLAPDAGVVVGDALVIAIAALAYQGSLRRALGRLKYRGVSRAAEPVARATLPSLLRLTAIAGPVPLVPIPVHAERLRERGYNQARLLADALGRLAGLPVLEALVRVRPTTQQHRLDRAARLRNLRRAFAPADEARPVQRVILVDDILTTSATLEACAATLRAAGARAVYGLAVAREV